MPQCIHKIWPHTPGPMNTVLVPSSSSVSWQGSSTLCVTALVHLPALQAAFTFMDCFQQRSCITRCAILREGGVTTAGTATSSKLQAGPHRGKRSAKGRHRKREGGRGKKAALTWFTGC
jgi:hypothetical protein